MRTEPQNGDKIANLRTNQGEIKILLFTEHAPKTTENFINLAEQDKYDGTVFHRIIEDFMLQGGDIEHLDGRGGYSHEGPGTKIEDEFAEGLRHIKGAVSMANAGPDTGGSQFFIVQREEGTDWLDGKHAIFGYVIDGMELVDELAKLETDVMDKPLDDIVLEKVEILTFE